MYHECGNRKDRGNLFKVSSYPSLWLTTRIGDREGDGERFRNLAEWSGNDWKRKVLFLFFLYRILALVAGKMGLEKWIGWSVRVIEKMRAIRGNGWKICFFESTIFKWNSIFVTKTLFLFLFFFTDRKRNQLKSKKQKT